MDKRVGILLGLLALLIMGLAIGLVFLSPEDRSTNVPHIAVDDVDRNPADHDATDTYKRPSGKPGTHKGDTEPDKVDPETVTTKPVPKVLVQSSVSGLAIDYWEEEASGVTLTLLSEEGDSITGPTTTTDEDGLFTFEEPLTEGEQYFVACLEEGKAITATGAFTIEKDVATEGLVIQIFEQARAYGKVINGQTDEPLAGVEIKLSGRQDDRVNRLGRLLGRIHPVKSDESGKFEIDSIAPGKYLVRAEKQGWMANEFSPNTRAIQEMELDEYANFELLDFILIQAGIIEGKILKKADNSPIAGATVELGTVLGGSLATVVSNDDGSYRFDNVPPGFGGQRGPGAGLGGIAVRATAAGYAIATRDLRVRSGQTRSGVDLLMDDGCSITGIVYDNESQPVAGAMVYYNDNDFLRGGEMVAGIALPERSISSTTNEQGKFTLSNLPVGSVTVTASASGFANADAQATLTVGTPTEVVITLQLAGAIEGVVTNEYGEPIEGVPLAAYDASGPDQLGFVMKSFFGETLPDRGDSTMFPASIRTDAAGFYRIEGLKPGKYVVLANTRDFEKYVSVELEVKAGEATPHDIQLATGGTIFGRVYDANDQPESGVPVTCASLLGNDSVRIRTAYTDRSGNYELTGLSAGTYTVIRNEGDMTALMLPNSANQVKVAAGERVEFDIYSQRPGTARIYGRVTLDGVAYGDESLVLLGGSFAGFAANTTRTDKQGNYEFRSVPLGTYQIAQSGGRMPSLVRKRVRVDKEGDIEINIDFVTVTISGRVEVEGGKVPEGRVRVIASPVNPNDTDGGVDGEEVNDLEMMVFRETNADGETGAFEITGLSPGFYRLTVRSDNNGMVMKPYLNLRASVEGIVMTLPSVGATLKGVVTGLDGAENNTPFGLIGALTIEDEGGNPIALGGFDNGINLGDSKEFTVENLAEGRFTITLSMPGYTPSTHANIQFTAGETVSLEFVFAASGNVKITLLNEDIGVDTAFQLEYEIVNSKGEQFKKRFTFLDFFDSEGNATQNTDENAFVIKDLPPETYTITLMLPGFKNAAETFTIIAGETAEVSVQFEPE